MLRASSNFTAVLFTITAFLVSDSAQAYGTDAGQIPPCLNAGQVLPIDNHRISTLKTTTQNGEKHRGNLDGVISRFFSERPSHAHFEIQMNVTSQDEHGNTVESSDVIEVVYNKVFGQLPELAVGTHVQACGEYITSFARSGPYPPSPSKAIIHWVHQNPKENGRPPHGYLVINQRLFGFDYDPANDPRRHGFSAIISGEIDLSKVLLNVGIY